MRVAAAGVCHSDLHLAEGHLGSERVPIVLGHEGAGVVEAVGPDVRHAPGDHVAFCFVPACGACRPCLAGRPNLCEPAGAVLVEGHDADGTTRLHRVDGERLLHFNFVSCFAESCVVPVGIRGADPAGAARVEAALVGCAVVTAFGAVQRGRPRAARRVGLRHRLRRRGTARHRGCSDRRRDPIVAVDRGADKLERRGASAPRTRSTRRSRTSSEPFGDLSGGGVDHAFEVVGSLRHDPPGVGRASPRRHRGGRRPDAPGRRRHAPRASTCSRRRACRARTTDRAIPRPGIRSLAELAAADAFPIAEAVSDVTDLAGIDAAFDRLRDGVGARTIVLVHPELTGHPV